jgi:hypothetical protein
MVRNLFTSWVSGLIAALGLLLLIPLAASATVLELPPSWVASDTAAGNEYGFPVPAGDVNQVTATGDPSVVYMYANNPMSGTAIYYWYYGCSPTSGGMLIAWWDTIGGRPNLYYGDASVWDSGTQSMVASAEDIASGAARGMTYGSYLGHAPNCIADFMKTNNGGTSDAYEAIGLVNFAFWDNLATPIDESYHSTALVKTVPFAGGGLTWGAYTAEIDAGRPVLINILRYDGSSLYGHTVFAYGYETYNGLNWYAVHDTWGETDAQGNNDGSYWNIAGANVDNRLVNGVEWWPWVSYNATFPNPTSYPRNYEVYSGVFFDVDPQPEPTSLALFALGGVALLALRRRKPTA